MANDPKELWTLLISGKSDQFISGIWDAMGLNTYYNSNNYGFLSGSYFPDKNSSKWVQSQFMKKYDGKTTKILDKWTMSLKVVPSINVVKGSSRDTFLYDTFYFAFSNVLDGGVFFAERKIKLQNVDVKHRKMKDGSDYFDTWARYTTFSTTLNSVEFSQGNVSNWIKSYSQNAIYNTMPNIVPKKQGTTMSPATTLYGAGVGQKFGANIPTGVKNINDISAYSGRWTDLLGGLIYNFTPQVMTFKYLNYDLDLQTFIKELENYKVVSNYKQLTFQNNTWDGQYKITTENGIELKDRFFTKSTSSNNFVIAQIFEYSADNKTYMIDQINSEYVIYPIKIEKITSSNNNNSNTGSGSTGGSTGGSNSGSTSGGSAGGNSSNPSNAGNTTTGGNSGSQTTDLIRRFDAMKSGLWQKLKQSYVNGKDYYTDPDGNVYEIILLNGTDYLRKIDRSSLKTEKIDVTGKKFECGDFAFCNAKYKNCPQAIYMPEDYKDYNDMAKDNGGSYVTDGDFVKFANGKIYKNIGLTRPILCPEVQTIKPPIENIQTENLPCCIQKNDSGEYVYFYKGKTYPAKKTIDNKFVADLGEGWRFIQDCIPVEPQKAPEPCDLYIKELSQLQEKNKSLQTEISKLREGNTSNSSMLDELNRLREENFQYEKDLITNYSPAREKELEVALKNAKDRISDLERELELTQNNNGEELNSHLDYCCECEYERNCCEY